MDTDDLGFIVDEDQTTKEMPSAEGWQDQFHGNLRRGWLQGHKAFSEFPDMKVSDNPYTARGGDDLIVITLALGWEDGFSSAEQGGTVDDCPYPEV